MGSALSDFNKKHLTEFHVDDLMSCADTDDCKYLPLEKGQMSLDHQQELKEYLDIYMNYFGINDKYHVDIFDSTCKVSDDAYCCSINSNESCKLQYNLGVSFLARDEYLFDKMKFMISSSILIFLLLTAVSVFILFALIKQKKITSNNIDFFNNTAHELKTPLTNIKLALSLLTKKHTEFKDDRYIHIIEGENKRLSDQVERVLFLSRMENGEQQLNKESIDICILLQEVVDNMSLLIQEKKGRVNINSATSEARIIGDYYHISNAFKNILDNALKYCKGAPEINIFLTEEKGHIKVLFQDNGIGISKSDQNHIFEKFQRVNTGDVRETKGFGIGLSYVRKVIEMHQGLIRLKSELNKGSQFELIFPNL